jgi:hypothetical protein
MERVVQSPAVSEWIYFIHPPREDFAATMTAEEQDVWSVHFERFERLPVIAGGFARGELRQFRISLVQGRDGGPPWEPPET